MNLLNNAVKYTDPGGRIEVGVLVEGGQAVITIRDTGIGIPQDRLDGVFEMFSQVESALSRSRGGLGIGLSLTQRLVQMHGGNVKAYSDGPGHGSRFHVTLPLATAEELPEDAAPATPAATAADDKGLRILVADDNADAAETMSALLEEMGHVVRHVGDGEAAVQVCGEFDPQLVLLDIGMPKVNGYDACRRIRAASGKRRVIVAVTGWGQPQDHRRSQEAGFDRHLVKPIDIDALTEVIDSVDPAALAQAARGAS
jgi:CheY-like chemotaxis protein